MKRRRIKQGRRNPQIYSRTAALKVEKNYGIHRFIFLLIILGLGGLTYLSPVFKIKSVIIIGSESPQKQTEYEEQVKGFVGQNLLFLNIKEIENLYKKGDIKDLEISKNFFNRMLKIELIPRKSFVVLIENGKEFLVDDSGQIYREVGEAEKASLGLLKINNNIPTIVHNPGDNLLELSKFINLKEILNNFNLKTSDQITSVNFENSEEEITVLTDKNYRIYFDLRKNVANALENVALVKKEAEKKKKKLEYIDLRIDTRIFYK